MAATNRKSVNVVVHTRPYSTHYYESNNTTVEYWQRVGRAATPLGAVRAAVVRLLLGRSALAIVHGPAGEVMFRISRVGGNIRISGLFETFTFEK